MSASADTSASRLREASDATPSRASTAIPVYFRIVPKDLWLRIHVDTSSTIGTVKDAVLERLQMPPVDPTLHSRFYEEACAVSKGSGLPTTASRAFPKSFLAREPKRTVQEVLAADEQRKAGNMDPRINRNESKKLRKEREKIAALRNAANSVLRGDPGDGGIGASGGIGMPMSDAKKSAPQNSNLPQVSPSKSHVDKAKTIEGGKMVGKVLAKPERPGKSVKRLSRQGGPALPQSLPSEPLDLSILSSLDAYDDVAISGLLGNEAAKKSEEEAMASLRARSQVTALQDFERGSHSTPHSSDESAAAAADSSKYTDEDGNDDDDDDGDSVGRASVAEMAEDLHPSSMNSSSSESSHLGAGKDASFEDQPSQENEGSTDALATVDLSLARDLDRARSRTIHAGQIPNKPPGNIEGSSTEELNTGDPDREQASVSVIDIPLPKASTRVSRSGTLVQQVAPQLVPQSAETDPVSPNAERDTAFSSSFKAAAFLENPSRLGGIHADEISSWHTARHSLASCFSVHSFSNGTALEDWRTVAALQIRPFELLELQYSHPHFKIYLPRIGQSNESLFTSHADIRHEANRKAHEAKQNPALDLGYLEPFVEGWCYIFKRGSGPSKAQRAGVGVWKLRWLSVRATRFVVFRKKPARGADMDNDGDFWNLEAIDSVFCEKADGACRPPLPYIAAQSTEILTISFRGLFVPPDSVHNEGSQYKQPTLSMRFVTQTDHHAFFATFVRARFRHTLRFADPAVSLLATEWRRRALARASIAGLGGTVVFGKAARRQGRNALLRTRLRPPGTSREFDDADRWSSESESEDVVPRQRQSAFNYAGVSGGPDLSNVPPIPSLLDSYRARNANDADSSPLPSSPAKQKTALHQNFSTLAIEKSKSTRSNLAASSIVSPQASPLQPKQSTSLPQQRSRLSHLAQGDLDSPTIPASSSSGLVRGSPSSTNMTAHDLRRQQRFAFSNDGDTSFSNSANGSQTPDAGASLPANPNV